MVVMGRAVEVGVFYRTNDRAEAWVWLRERYVYGAECGGGEQELVERRHWSNEVWLVSHVVYLMFRSKNDFNCRIKCEAGGYLCVQITCISRITIYDYGQVNEVACFLADVTQK